MADSPSTNELDKRLEGQAVDVRDDKRTQSISDQATSIEATGRVAPSKEAPAQTGPASDSISDHIHNSNLTHSNSRNIEPQLTIEQQIQKSKKDLESMVIKYAMSERENLQNKSKVDELDKKLKRVIKDNDQLANRIKLLNNDKTSLTDNLNAKVAQLTVLEQKNSYLTNVQGQKLKDIEEKNAELTACNEKLTKMIESYKSREGELLDFSERLSMKHMMLQSELESALQQISSQKDPFDTSSTDKEEQNCLDEDYSKQVCALEESLQREQEISASLRATNSNLEAKFRREIDELHNEIKLIRRKHQIVAKEMAREIKHLHLELAKSNANNTQS